MRRWLIVAGLAAVAGTAVVGFALYRLSRALDENRQWIEARAEAVVGRPVRCEHIGVSLRGGLGVRVTALRVADDPRFADADFLRADAVEVAVRILPALSGRFEVRRVRIERPELTVIRTADGVNLESLGAAGTRAAVDVPALRAGPRTAAARPPRVRASAASGVVPAAATDPVEDGVAGDRDAAGAAAGRLVERAAAVAVARLRVHDGTLRWVDRTVEPPLDVGFRHLDLEVSDLSLSSAMELALQAAVLDADAANLRLEGTVGPLGVPPALEAVPFQLSLTADDVPAGAFRHALPRFVTAGSGQAVPLGLRVRMSGTPAFVALDARATAGRLAVETKGTLATGAAPDADLTVRVPRVRLADLGPLVPALREDGVGGSVEADLRVRGPVRLDAPPPMTGTVSFAEASFGSRGPSGITTTVRVDGAVADIPPTRVEVGDAAMQAAARVRLEGARVLFDPVTVEAFGGVMQASGALALDERSGPRISGSGTARAVSVAKLVAVRSADLSERLEGWLDADFDLTAGGRTAEALRRSLGGTARITVRQAVVRGFNVAESVLEGVTGGVRGLVSLVPQRLRVRHPELFGAAKTRIEELRVSARLVGQVARVDELVATARAWTTRAAGTVELGGPLDLRGSFTASRQLTAEILDAVGEARWIVAESGLLVVPFHLTGTPPDLRTVPDPAFVTRALQRALAERGVEPLREGRRGRERGHDADGVQGLIRRGLDELLGR